MTIDIINYTDEQYALLTVEQLKEVRSAQVKKDKLEIKMEEELQEAKDDLIRKGIYNSGLYLLIKNKLKAEYEEQVELIRDGLQFYLKYSMQPEGTTWDAPYTVNFALSYEARLTVVRNYYDSTYENAAERFEAFQEDVFAPRYLGELYASLYAHYRGQASA